MRVVNRMRGGWFPVREENRVENLKFYNNQYRQMEFVNRWDCLRVAQQDKVKEDKPFFWWSLH